MLSMVPRPGAKFDGSPHSLSLEGGDSIHLEPFPNRCSVPEESDQEHGVFARHGLRQAKRVLKHPLDLRS
jgi:hypothetical protein